MSDEPVGGGSDPSLAGPPSPPVFEPPRSPSVQFPEPTVTPPGFAPDAGGFVSQPHFMSNGYWVSFDRMHWWNGAMWVLGTPPARRPGSIGTGGTGAAIVAIVSVIGFVVFAIVVLSMCQSMQTLTPPVP